ncbi:MAG: hypothetical protein ACD_76C00094G0002 [uncultured bacterium]|nr:MAG: hypothetical protein ACD_76C00094G0002 [uncultured bacterium]HBD05256.1 30S ribosomal protein S7 [Candidatus Uhrbacteria bacterium]
MRGKQAKKRALSPDPKFGNLQIAKFVNYTMQGGKKSVARAVIYNALDMISAKTKQDPVVIFETAIKNVGPAMEVRSRRVGGANYQIPMPVRGERKFYLACHWLLNAAHSKKGRGMAEKLADELVLASQEQGDAWKKKEDVHKMAEANRAFAHFARR